MNIRTGMLVLLAGMSLLGRTWGQQPAQAGGSVAVGVKADTRQFELPAPIRNLTDGQITEVAQPIAAQGQRVGMAANAARIEQELRSARAQGNADGITFFAVHVVNDSNNPNGVVVLIETVEVFPTIRSVRIHEQGHTEILTTFWSKVAGRTATVRRGAALPDTDGIHDLLAAKAPAGMNVRDEIRLKLAALLAEKPNSDPRVAIALQPTYDRLESTNAEQAGVEQLDDTENAKKIACIKATFLKNALRICLDRRLPGRAANITVWRNEVSTCMGRIIFHLNFFLCPSLTLRNLDATLRNSQSPGWVDQQMAARGGWLRR